MKLSLPVLVILTIAQVGSAENRDPPPSGRWLFDGGARDSGNWCVVDQGPNQIHGVVRGSDGTNEPIEYDNDVPFPYDGNYSLDFVADQPAAIIFPDHPLFGFSGDFTIQFWLRFSDLSRDVMLVSKMSEDGTESGFSLWWDRSSESLRFDLGGSLIPNSWRSGWFLPERDRWYHVAVIRRKGLVASTVRFVLDGRPLRALGTSVLSVASSTHEGPLRIGSAGTAWDELSIVAASLPIDELSSSSSLGPGQRVFGDGFDTYAPDELPWDRGGPVLNQWRRIAHADGAVRWLGEGPGRSGSGSIEISVAGDETTPYGNSIAYYRFPLAMVNGAARVGFEGWVSFEDLADARLFFLSEVFTGRVPPVGEHYGRTEALIAGGIQYNSRSRTWQWEQRGGSYPYTDFSGPMDYPGDIERFHYFKVVVDFEAARYVSFQFDDDVWTLDEHELLVFDPDIHHDPTPAMYEFNIRLITYDEYDGPFECRVVVDDVAVTVEP